MVNPAICLISTRKYKIFVEPIVKQIDEFFLPDYPKTIFLFTDEYQRLLYSKNDIRQIIIPSYGFPYASLYRYKIFNNNSNALSEHSHIFYLDVDMAIVRPVTDEILFDGLTVVYHPGFFSKRNEVGHWGSNGVAKNSLAYIEPEKRSGYVAGGFNGGSSTEFLKMSAILAANIHDDETRMVMAEYHDESHLNAYLKNVYVGAIQKLAPDHCMVEQMNLRKQWGIDMYEPKIIALAKNHQELRS